MQVSTLANHNIAFFFLMDPLNSHNLTYFNGAKTADDIFVKVHPIFLGVDFSHYLNGVKMRHGIGP